ncbi:PQQ-binding-like beta-propeller repeat protein [Streptomyces sp. NPDC048337]|uniref:protein kinase domain-containing protein n=1 Tax=Streptomyces sp. NPDC048337 TaxID=3365535 RepID=UPI00371AB068
MPLAPAPFTPLTHDDPQDLGGYRLLARLGSGGMGTVYLARSSGGRTVALKTVHTRIAADTSFRTRFRLESDAARIIGDRYGARVFGADPLAATPWLATEYVLGPQLDEAVRISGPLPEACVRSLGADLALALGQLHRSDVVHRDLKPSNIMVTATGPKVIDFGIARALGDERLTSVGAAAGTPAYMSPEQAGGLEHTPAGDVFALAGVLVFAASGHGPFGGGQAADLLYRVRYADPDLSGVPAELAPLLARCLSKDPALRPTTAELARLLTPGDGVFADGLPQPVLADITRRSAAVWQEPPGRLAAPAGEPTTVVAAGMSRRRLFSVGGGVLGAAALAAAGAVWAWPDEPTDAKPPALAEAPASLWKISLAGTSADFVPLWVGDGPVLAAGLVARKVEPKTGALVWQQDLQSPWRMATDGKELYALREPDAEAAKAGRAGALAVGRVPPVGLNGKPSVTLDAFDGNHKLAQLLCVEGDTAYLSAKAAAGAEWFLVAASLKSGRELWRQKTAAPFERQSSPALVRGKVVKGGLLLCRRSEAGESLGLSLHDTATGAMRWEKTGLSVTGALPYALATDEDHVYIGADSLQALRLIDGATAWSFGEGRDMGNKPYGMRRYGIPTVHEGVVYVVESARGIVAVDARTGVALWSEEPLKDTTADGDVAPVVVGRLVLTMDKIGLRAVYVRSHKPLWRYPTTAVALAADPGGGRVYAREERMALALPIDG